MNRKNDLLILEKPFDQSINELIQKENAHKSQEKHFQKPRTDVSK